MAAARHDPEGCSICGRTILSGERVHVYVARDGERHRVCELCRARAEAGGWVPEDLAEAMPADSAESRRPGLRAWVAKARERGPREAPEEHVAPAPEREEQTPHFRSLPRSPEIRRRRAMEHFNRTDGPRRVAGLMRSLGVPWVSAVVSETRPADVRLTVAWELSWYQWEVDLESGSVRESGKGNEVEEIPKVDWVWNARAASDGTLVPDPQVPEPPPEEEPDAEPEVKPQETPE